MKQLEDLTTRCIRCGFCLEACPTFQLTGLETDSPRGRIYLARSANEGKIGWEEARESLDRCLGCRACEPACPSGVEYGLILEQARQHLLPSRGQRLATNLATKTFWQKAALLSPFRRIPWPLSTLLSKQRPQADVPHPTAKYELPPLQMKPTKGQVQVLQGCAMETLFPNVNFCTERLLRRVGYEPVELRGCCGALHAHAGMLDEAAEMLKNLKAGDTSTVVNSAGCGSWMKEARQNAQDLSEFLLDNGLIEQLRSTKPVELKVAYHDACHLAHGQRITAQPRALIEAIPGLQKIELEHADTCCGSAGTYNLTQPTPARQLLDRKWQTIEASRAQVVVLGNPGCHAWIRQAAGEHGNKVKVMHLAELLEAALSGINPLSA